MSNSNQSPKFLEAVGMFALILAGTAAVLTVGEVCCAYFSGELGCHCQGCQESAEPAALPPPCCPPGCLPPPENRLQLPRPKQTRVPFDLPLRELHPISHDSTVR